MKWSWNGLERSVSFFLIEVGMSGMECERMEWSKRKTKLLLSKSGKEQEGVKRSGIYL